MYREDVKVTHGVGRYKVEIIAHMTSDGISVTIMGGEKPHVGGTALSVPRKSLAGAHSSCDTWICPVPGHKDTIVASAVAETVCRRTGQTVAVVAGIHIDNADEGELRILVENSERATGELLKKINQILESENA